jgi:hypothetical protein
MARALADTLPIGSLAGLRLIVTPGTILAEAGARE